MTSSSLPYVRSDILKHLKKIFQMESFQEKDIQRLLRISEIRKYRCGQVITGEAITNGYIYYLISGRVRMELGENLFQVFSHTGAHFCETSILDKNHRPFSAMAVEDCVCVAINLKRLEGLIETGSYAFKYGIFRKIAEDLSSKLNLTIDELIKAQKEISRLKKKH